MTPEVVVEETSQPAIIDNPYCAPTSGRDRSKEDEDLKTASVNKSTVKPTWIINPFVESNFDQKFANVSSQK